MPIEIVCKIKFAEEDEKQAAKEEGDQESLLEEPGRPRHRGLAAFAGASTLHGLGHICRSGRLGVRQALWALAFVASLAFFLYQAARSALFYLEHPHVTSLDEEAAHKMVFPAVTICNINRFRHSALTDADIFHLANMTGLPPKDRDGHKASDLLYPDPDMADIVNRTGHQLDDMLKNCSFSGENCSAENFTVSRQELLTQLAHCVENRGLPAESKTLQTRISASLGEKPTGRSDFKDPHFPAASVEPAGSQLLKMTLSCCPDGSPVPRMDGSLGQATARFLRLTKLHGLHYMGSRRQSRTQRLFWSGAILASLGLLCTWSTNRVQYLRSKPVHTRAHMLQATRLHFPAVTFCNYNPARFLQLTRPDLYSVGRWLGLTYENHSLLPTVLEELPDEQRPWLSYLANYSRFLPPRLSPHTMESFFHRMGHQIEDMLLECHFQGKPCGPQDFTPVYTRYGKCYTFNGDRNKPRVTRQSGMGNGLEIMLDIQQEEYLPIWRETNETSFEAGIRVQIHSQDEPPYIHQLGFGVSPGFQTFVSCQEQRLTYLPQPWGSCRTSMKGEQILPGYETYSIAACRLQCEKEAVVRNCQCRMVHMPGNESICSPNVYIECADHTLDTAVEDSQERCVCPTPCNLTRYGKEISMVRIPNKGSARYLARKYNRNETYIRENFLVLDIFFEALNYEAIEQKKAYNLAGLLGDIGGQMGLFIGASVLTVLEILDYIYEVIRDKVAHGLRRPKPPLKKPSGSIATLGLEEIKEQSPCETLGRHSEGTYPTGLLPNHHHRHHYSPQGVFEDFAC